MGAKKKGRKIRMKGRGHIPSLERFALGMTLKRHNKRVFKSPSLNDVFLKCYNGEKRIKKGNFAYLIEECSLASLFQVFMSEKKW